MQRACELVSMWKIEPMLSAHQNSISLTGATCDRRSESPIIQVTTLRAAFTKVIVISSQQNLTKACEANSTESETAVLALTSITCQTFPYNCSIHLNLSFCLLIIYYPNVECF